MKIIYIQINEKKSNNPWHYIAFEKWNKAKVWRGKKQNILTAK